MLLEHVPCDLCGSEAYRERYRKPDTWLRAGQYAFPVVECRRCGLVFVNPRPTRASMAAFYPAGYHADRDTAVHRRRYARQRAQLPDLAGKHVLDIGCASGDFLAYLLETEPPFHAYGVDAFSPGVTDDRIAFTRGELPDVRYGEGRFDLVMAWAVFEHLHAPMAYFRDVARILKPGGSLVILVTNADSAYGRLAQSEDVPRHTYHYSRHTLERYGAAAGLALDDLHWSDDIYDGRGFGSFGMLFGRAAGFTWEREMLGDVRPHQRLAMRAGRALDRLVFTPHWEARLGRGGIMVATYARR